jgi:purine nucleosidase
MAWLPDDFVHPERVDLPTGHHLRPIRASDVDLDLPAVLGSQQRLFGIYGPAWGWPPATMTPEQDEEDLRHHEEEIAAHASFNYALFDEGETALLGCVYLDPSRKAAADAEISWWVVDELVGTDVEAALDAFVPAWVATAWPFTAPAYVPRDISWADWAEQPDREPGAAAAARVPLFLDCDTGIDDSVAIAYLLASPEVELVGVSTVSGNTDARQAARNTLAVLALSGREDVPVAVGAEHPQDGRFDGGAPQVHGRNGIGEVQLADPTVALHPATGPDLLIEQARRHPGRLHLLAIGPLTNVAAALRAEPELARLVPRITIMGGAVTVGGNITPHAEANIGNDAAAAAEVFAADWEITVVGLDVTMTQHLQEDIRQRLLAGGPVAAALGRMLEYYFGFYRDTTGAWRTPVHDPLAAALAVGGATADRVLTTQVRVITEGEERGRTMAAADGAPGARHTVVLSVAGDPVTHIVDRILAG